MEMDDCTGLGGDLCWAASLRRLCDLELCPLGRIHSAVPKAVFLHGALVLGWTSNGLLVGTRLLSADDAAMFMRGAAAVALMPPNVGAALTMGARQAGACTPRDSLRKLVSLMGQP